MGRQRSVHNTYFTLPVLFTMISNHYAGLYGHEWNWVLLLMISVAGALIRVWFVQRHKGNQNPLVLAAGLVMLALTAIVSLPRPDGRYRPAGRLRRGPADLPGALPVLPRHQADAGRLRRPAQGGGPGDTEAELRARAAMINQQVWVTRVMPPGNLTNITDAERRLIARWVKGGAQ